jgi:hypothetical protein
MVNVEVVMSHGSCGLLLKLAAGCAGIGAEQRCKTALALVVWRRVRFLLGFPELTKHCMVWPRFY